jgi:hypothetical protein
MPGLYTQEREESSGASLTRRTAAFFTLKVSSTQKLGVNTMVLPSVAFLGFVFVAAGLVLLGIWLGRKITSTKLKMSLLAIWFLGLIGLYTTSGSELIGLVPFFSLLWGLAFIYGLACGINRG